jgi:RND family efflux transporter MFP subunit
VAELEVRKHEWEAAPRPRGARRPSRALIGLIVLALAAGGVGFAVYTGIRTRAAADVALKRATEEAAVPVVNVIQAKAAAPSDEIVLPGTTQAFIDAPIYARTDGYLRRWYFDIGARVKRGDLLAEIETPEVDQQLQQARADLQTARANLNQARITAERWQLLLKTDSVSKQETDQAVNSHEAMKATVQSNAANVGRLEQLQGFQKVYAPFDGVVTARNTDIGALIAAGASAQGRELFHVAAIHKLRVFVAVPEVHARAARPGATATLTLDQFPGRSFHGTLARTSNSIDLASRTLLVEVDVDNTAGELLPGAYVNVHLNLGKVSPSVTIPANTLLFRSEGLHVGLVRNGRAELVPVTIGRDYGSTVEVAVGLRPGDQVILDPSDSLVTGTPVRVSTPRTVGAGS